MLKLLASFTKTYHKLFWFVLFRFCFVLFVLFLVWEDRKSRNMATTHVLKHPWAFTWLLLCLPQSFAESTLHFIPNVRRKYNEVEITFSSPIITQQNYGNTSFSYFTNSVFCRCDDFTI